MMLTIRGALVALALALAALTALGGLAANAGGDTKPCHKHGTTWHCH